MFFEIMNYDTFRNPSRVWNVLTIEFMTELNKRSIEPKQRYVMLFEIFFFTNIQYQ